MAVEVPKISVILPVYNVEPFIGRCIESLRAQTFAELEFIFVDDCSTDGSMAVVEAWVADDPRARIIRNEKNLGQGYSRNRGIEAARGDYLAFVDPDDYLSPDFYALLYSAATADGGHDIAKGLRCLVDAETGEVSPASRILNERIRAQLADGKPLYAAFTYEHQSAIFRHTLFQNEDVRYGTTRNSEDITFLLRCCYQTEDLVFEEAAIYFYVQREGSIVHGDAVGIANGQLGAMAERIEFLSQKGLDAMAVQYLLARSNDCLTRLQNALGDGRARQEDYDRIAARIAEVVRPLPGALEVSYAWPKVQEALVRLRPKAVREHCDETAAPAQVNNSVHFVFDSEHVDAMQTRLYGFYTTELGMFTQAPPEGKDIDDATGPWVLVMRNSEGIEITQDAIGCFGLFLFRKGSYWALSNSFNHLLDYLKGRFELSFNENYALAMLVQDLCVSVYGETIISEIMWLDRRARLHIDLETTELTVALRRLGEGSVPVDSEEGLRILDKWHDKWASLVRGAAKSRLEKIVVEISGGFDTRMVLAPVLSSGVDLAHISFNSIPSLEEDYRIAALLAQKFGFCLNAEAESTASKPIPPNDGYAERTTSTIFFEKRIREQSPQLPDAWHMVFSGAGGGLSRGFWKELGRSALIDKELRRLQSIDPQPPDARFRQSIEATVCRSCSSIEIMLKQTEGDVGTEGINGLQYYMETRNRSHFGMSLARRILFGWYEQTPLLDPLMLRLHAPLDGRHPQLIPALVFTRYHEELASFPIEGGRTIPEDTLRFARELNERHPRIAPASSEARQTPTNWQVVHVPIAEVLGEDAEADIAPMSERFLEAYESPTVWSRFIEQFGSSPDEWKEPNLEKRYLNGDKYAVVSIAKALDDIKRGKDAHKDFGAFIEACRREAVTAAPIRERFRDALDLEKSPHRTDDFTKVTFAKAALATVYRKAARKIRALLGR